MRNIKQKFYQNSVLILTLITISGCSTYSSKFKCSEARGLGCTMIRDIDQQIDSGQIEEAYKNKNKKCRGRDCASKNDAVTQELLRVSPKNKATLHDYDAVEIIDDENSLYF